MADFFSNLLLRSSAQASGAILQPRLPSLFEATHGAADLPAPPADAELPESGAARYEDADVSRSAGQNRNQNTGSPARPSAPVSLPERPLGDQARRQPPSSSDTNSNAHGAVDVPDEGSDLAPAPAPALHERRAAKKPAAPAQPRLPAQHARQPEQSTHVARKPEAPSVLDAPEPPAANMLEAQRTVRAAPVERDARAALPVASAGRAAEMDAPENRSPQVEPRPAGVQQTGQRSPFPAKGVTPTVVENHPAESTVRPYPDATPAGAILKPLLTPQPVSAASHPTTAAMMTRAQPVQEQEHVVQVHIGRIEVRAVAPPAASPPAPTPRSQPRMSLDEYLRQREEKR